MTLMKAAAVFGLLSAATAAQATPVQYDGHFSQIVNGPDACAGLLTPEDLTVTLYSASTEGGSASWVVGFRADDDRNAVHGLLITLAPDSSGRLSGRSAEPDVLLQGGMFGPDVGTFELRIADEHATCSSSAVFYGFPRS
jgi:hypothetical protein